MVTMKHCFQIEKIIEVQLNRNILVATKLSSELIQAVMFHDKGVFTMVRDKIQTDAHKINKVNS